MIYDAARRVAVYEGEDVPRVLTALPTEARRINGHYVAVRASVSNIQTLKVHGLPVPPVIPDHGWPGKHPKPFHAQWVTANFLMATPRGFVLSDMGTGKTLSALIAAEVLMREAKSPFRALIVAPISTMRSVWGKEIFDTFLDGRKYIVLHGSREKRLELLKKPADYYIINYEGVGLGFKDRKTIGGLSQALIDRKDIQLVIVDEASAYKDGTTLRHHAAMSVLSTKPYVWMMTGTPTPNAPTDAYGLAKIVNNAKGESFRAFRERTMMPVSTFKLVPRPGAYEQARRLLTPSVRFAIGDCVDLPPCTTQQREVPLTAEQEKFYKELKRDCQVVLGGSKRIDAPSEGVLRMKLLQIVCGSVYAKDRSVHHVDATPRLKELEAILAEAGTRKAIIFAPLTSVINRLYSLLVDHRRAVVNGGTTPKERKEIFDRFCDPEDKLRLLIADPQTMAHGLTLTTANVVVWYGPTDKTELYLQANKRIDRPGQTVPTTVVQLTSTPIEKEIYRRLENNETLQGVMLKLAEGEL